MLSDILNDSAKMIFIAMAIAILSDAILAFFFYTKTKAFLAKAAKATARITRIEKKETAFLAHVSFKNEQGQVSETGIFLPNQKLSEGDDIDILYHQENPGVARRDSFAALWLLPVILLYTSLAITVLLGILVSMDIASLPF